MRLMLIIVLGAALAAVAPSSFTPPASAAEPEAKPKAPPKVAVPKPAKSVDKVIVSPDGKRRVIVGDFQQEIDLAPIRRVPAKDLWLQGADGKVKRLTKGKRGESAAWSPDGKHLAYISQSSLWIATGEGKKPRRVLKERLPKGEPQGEYDYDAYYGHVWSPDSKFVVAFHTSGGTANPLVVDATSGKVVYTGEDEVYHVGWNKDGSLALWDGVPADGGANLVKTVKRSDFKSAKTQPQKKKKATKKKTTKRSK